MNHSTTRNKRKSIQKTICFLLACCLSTGSLHAQSGESGYAYDLNGNLTKDSSRNITNIQYNFLNLPTRIEFTNGNTVSYMYDAKGAKLRTTYQGEGMTKTIDYCGNVIYEDGELRRILVEGGYITFADDGKPVYHYYLQDHQGNNRVVVDEAGNVEQVNHYYPFGGTFEESTADAQPYKYNGKELDKTFGLNLYDYGARFMDPALGRFTTMDPLAEKYYSVSPYGYCKNNPVNRIDPDGRDDYTFSSKGHIHRSKKIPGSTTDRLVTRTGSKAIVVNDRGLLPGLNKNHGKDASRRRHFQSTSNIEDAVNVFKFAADNTDVEWGLDVYVNGGEQSAVISTNLDPGRVSKKASRESNEGKEQTVNMHSHPSGDSTHASEADQTNALGNAKNAIYHPNSSTLVEYDSEQVSIQSSPAQTDEDLLNYIRNAQ